MHKKVTGTKDILPQESYRWQEIEELSRKIFVTYNYKEIRTPLIENSSLFHRSLGESTEIIQKQMFLINPSPADFNDVSEKEKKQMYALRPEGTASIARAYIENGLFKTTPFIKLYYIQAMFRLERPQKGRLRQFHHIGSEVIGSNDASVDVEVISLADRLLKNYSLDNYKIKINSLGCVKDKKKLTQILRDSLKDKAVQLCGDCQVRFKQNILRVLDCKKETCREITNALNIHNQYLCDECSGHFASVKEGLDSLKINYEITPYLVRGLDYYTRTVFELTHENLGAQDALGAGGRYDNLISELGGPDTGAMGFAFGVERILLALGAKTQDEKKSLAYIISLGEKAKPYSLKLLDDLRKAGIASDTDYEGKSLKGAMRKANDLQARYVLIIGENELNTGTVTLKDMASGEQKEASSEQIINQLRGK